MTARSLGEALGLAKRKKVRRTFQPVRRNSFNVGERERRFWSHRSREELYAIFEAAKQHDRVTRQPGQRNGDLGHVGLELLELIVNMAIRFRGRLEPSIEFMMKMTRRSRDAIVRAKEQLRKAGFLEWMRRTEPIENVTGAGPRVRQVTNIYRVEVPASWKQRIAMRVAQRLRGHNSETPIPMTPAAAEPNLRPIGTPGLEGALARLGKLVEQSASHPSGQNRPEDLKG